MTDYKLMPKQITKEMADAFWEEYSKDRADDLLIRCYKALYVTAPAPQPAELQPDAAPAAHGPLFLSDEKILEIASNPMVTPCSPWWLKNDVKSGDVQNSAIAFARAVLKAAAPAVQGEPAAYISHTSEGDILGWERQFDAPSHTPLYTAPQLAEQQPDVTQLVEALEEIRGLPSVRQDERDALRAECEKLRTCLAETAGVAVTMLYESHKADTIKEFTVEQLSQMVETTKHLADANVQVEKVYRKAWGMAHGCDGADWGGSK